MKKLSLTLLLCLFCLAALVDVCASVPISIALGRKDYKNANNAFSCSVLMIFISSIVMGVIMFFAATPLCSMMGADDVLLDTSVRYLRACALCSPLASIFFAMDNYLRICGFVKTSMVINIGCNLLTLGLLTFFLIGLNMDVVGSALAASLAMSISAFIAMIPFLRKGKTLLQFQRPRFHWGLVREIAACGSPVFLSNISGRVASILMNISLMAIGTSTWGEGGGTTAVAVYAILMYSSDLCWPLLYGISDSLSPAIGYNWGAQNYGRVKKILKCGFIGTSIVGLVSTSVLFFFPHVIAALFANSEDAMLLSESSRAIRLFCFAYLFRWFGVTTQGFFSAIERPMLATVMSVSTAFVFPIFFLGALWGLGLDGIWLNFVGVNIFTAVLAGILLSRVMRAISRQGLCRSQTVEASEQGVDGEADESK
jgi:Na+-driven multidrug efflux pump